MFGEKTGKKKADQQVVPIPKTSNLLEIQQGSGFCGKTLAFLRLKFG
jgi:hypothetical protein